MPRTGSLNSCRVKVDKYRVVAIKYGLSAILVSPVRIHGSVIMFSNELVPNEVTRMHG